MFDGLLKSKFYSKCKSAIKLTRTRIEMIRRKRNAMQKYLKNDIVDLLKNGLDFNAYGRAEGFLIEMNLSSCYDFTEQCCVCISNHLSIMNKQRECPEECREAVPSLMIAAAKFADLPELRELRSIFAERYGNSVEPYINKEFVNKVKSKPPTKDMKLQLIQDIALESGIEWDSKALEQKLYKPPPSEQDWLNTNDDNYKIHKRRDESVWKLDNQDTEDKHRNFKHYGETEEKNPKEEADDKEHLDYRSIPPPYYINPKVGTNETSLDVPHTSAKLNGHLDGEDNHHEDESVREDKPMPRSVRRRPLKLPPGHDNVESAKGGRKKTNSSEKKQGLKILNEDGHDQMDEEERAMDRLLAHYSSKQSPFEQAEVDASKATKHRSKDGFRTRGTSLPAEPTSSTEATKGHARATSFQPEMLNPSGHVHPKLPDYDDLVARLAALKGK